MEDSLAASGKNKLAQLFSKVLLNGGTGIGISPDVLNGNPKSNEKEMKDPFNSTPNELQDRAAMESFLAQLFASVTAIKAAYAELQFSQFPYDPDGIEIADQTIVLELKILSELKQSYVKKQVNEANPGTKILLSEFQEVKSLQKVFEITIQRLDSEHKLKDSEITFLKEKFAEVNREVKSLEKNLYSNRQLAVPEFSNLNHNHFITYLHQAMKSIRSFVRLMLNEMESAKWNLDIAASATQPRVSWWTPERRFYAFESFVCKEMFEGFIRPDFGVGAAPESNRGVPLDQFTEVKFAKPGDYLTRKPKSQFATFCRAKYLKVVHPKMEASFFGNTNSRDLIESGGGVPETVFFSMFGEMAKQVWLLHCLGQSMDPQVTLFWVSEGTRFSEVYMQSIGEEEAVEQRVGFTVAPGFKIGKTVVQCKVYLC